MKKFLVILLALILALPVCVPVHAEKTVVQAGWGKYLGSTDVTVREENGEKIYSFGGINAAYHSACVNVLPDLQKLMEGNDSITVEISVEVKIDYNEGYEDEDFPIGFMLRANGVHEKIKKAADFKKILPESAIHVVNGDSNYGCRIGGEDFTASSEEWTQLSGEVTLTPDDVFAGLWSSLILSFDKMSYFEAVKTVHVKNTTITLIDSEKGEGKPTVDLSTYVKEIIECDDSVDTPALPEGNKLLNTEWVKCLGTAVAEKGDFKGAEMYKVTGFNSSYASVGLDIYPSIKALMGDGDTANVWIVLDVRARGGEEMPFGMKIRPSGVSDTLNSNEGFGANYKGTTFKYTNSTGVCVTVLDEDEFTNTWHRVEIPVLFTSADINDEFWTGWNLCFDMMKYYDVIEELQIKNVGIYLYDEYEPINKADEGTDGETGDSTGNEKEHESSTGDLTIYRPIGFDKYTATFAEVVDTKVEGGLVDKTGNGGIDITLIIIIASAAVVVVAGTVTVIVIKNKKTGKGENE